MRLTQRPHKQERVRTKKKKKKSAEKTRKITRHFAETDALPYISALGLPIQISWNRYARFSRHSSRSPKLSVFVRLVFLPFPPVCLCAFFSSFFFFDGEISSSDPEMKSFYLPLHRRMETQTNKRANINRSIRKGEQHAHTHTDTEQENAIMHTNSVLLRQTLSFCCCCFSFLRLLFVSLF